MKFKCFLLVGLGLTAASAWADGTSPKSDLPITVLEKNMSSQLVLDTSTAGGKGDLLLPADQTVFIQPASAGPFEMVPDKVPGAAVAECAVSSLPQAEVQALVIKAAQEEGFDGKLALAVAGQESGFNPNALSDKGAFGTMQLMPATAADLKVNRCNPADNTRGGVHYLKSLMAKFGNPVFALAAYNAGPDAVAKYKGVPPFQETVQYVAQVLNRYYGAPEPQQDNVVVAALVPAKSPKKLHTSTNIVPASSTPERQVWASGFVMHLN